MTLWEGNFDHIQGQKTRYLGFLKSAEVGSCDSPTTWKTARFFINRTADRRSYLKTIPWSIFFIKHMCKVLVWEPNVRFFLIARRLYWDGWVNESRGSWWVGKSFILIFSLLNLVKTNALIFLPPPPLYPQKFAVSFFSKTLSIFLYRI